MEISLDTVSVSDLIFNICIFYDGSQRNLEFTRNPFFFFSNQRDRNDLLIRYTLFIHVGFYRIVFQLILLNFFLFFFHQRRDILQIFLFCPHEKYPFPSENAPVRNRNLGGWIRDN